MKQGVMALQSETGQEIQLPSGPLWLPAPARPTFRMGWLASASFATLFIWALASPSLRSSISRRMSTSSECLWRRLYMACEICNGLVVYVDGEQSTLKETLRQTPKTFTMAGTSLQVLTHWSQRATSEGILFRWEFQNGIPDLLDFQAETSFSFPYLQWPRADCLWACFQAFVCKDRICSWRSGNSSMN